MPFGRVRIVVQFRDVSQRRVRHGQALRDVALPAQLQGTAVALLGLAEAPEAAQGKASRVAGKHPHVEMLLVFGDRLGAGMPVARLVGQALERIQAAELRHPGDPGRVVFRGQDGQHLLEGGNGVVVTAAQYRKVGEMPQRAALGQDIASPGEPVCGTAQQQLRPIVIGARERGDAPGQRSQPCAPVIRLGLQQRAGLSSRRMARSRSPKTPASAEPCSHTANACAGRSRAIWPSSTACSP